MKNRQLLLWSVTVALAGFLFGFDTVVISGADTALQMLWNTSDLFHGSVIMGSALWGTVIGALFGGIPTDKYGRKNTLIVIGLLFFISALGSAVANDPYLFAVMRFVGGLGVGASTIAAPAYITEIAPPKDRGKLVALYQFNLVFGILIAYFSNYLLSGIEHQAWRWMLGVEAVPAILYTIAVFFVPKSPRWLLTKKQDENQARQILAQIYDQAQEVEDKIHEVYAQQAVDTSGDNIFQSKYSIPLMLAFFVAFFNQFSGINAFLYYAPRIFEMAGLEASASLLSSIGIGATNLLFTFIGMMLIDKLGRKQLLLIGCIGYIISLTLVACAFYLDWQGLMVPMFLFLFIASHAIGQGAVIWVYISEIFPNSVRATGQSFGVSVHWILAALIPSFTLTLFSSIGPGNVFAIFAGMMVLQLVWILFFVIETNGVSLEDLQKKLVK